MKQIILTITAKAPLAIGQRKPGGSVSEALDYIPGSVIRGAIAGVILQQSKQSPEPGDQFHALFLDEAAAVFHNAYPAIAQVGESQYQPSIGEVRLLPATALSSKINDGFKPKGGVFDSLIDSFCAREQSHFYDPNDLMGDRVESFKGFYSKQGNHYYSHSISKRLLTRVGINRKRATAEEKILYSLEVLNETQGKETPQLSVYRGAILVADELAEPLHQFIRRYEHNFRLGGSTSRGLGKVHIQTELQEYSVDAVSMQKRVERLTNKIQDRWRTWSIFNSSKPLPGKKGFFTLDLQADAILSENWLRTMVISEEMLRQSTQADAPIDDATLKLEMVYSSYDYRSGWNAAWGLRKDVELVTTMGSVFLFSTEQPEQWYAPLARLERRGVGDHCSEGYGQVRVCDEFHWVFREDPA